MPWDPESLPTDPDAREDLFCRLCLVLWGELAPRQDDPEALWQLWREADRQRALFSPAELAATVAEQERERRVESASERPRELPFAGDEGERLRVASARLRTLLEQDVERLCAAARALARAVPERQQRPHREPAEQLSLF